MTSHVIPIGTASTLQFASALSRKSDTEAAVRDLADAIRTQIGQGPIHLVFVFFSMHHAGKAELIASMVRDALDQAICIGCSGEGIIAGSEELETAPALALWAASLPNVRVAPLRLSFSPTHDQIRLSEWPEPSMGPSTFILLADPFPLRSTISSPLWPIVIPTAQRSEAWPAAVEGPVKTVSSATACSSTAAWSASSCPARYPCGP